MSLRMIGAIYKITHISSRQHNHEEMTDRTVERWRLRAAAKRKTEKTMNAKYYPKF